MILDDNQLYTLSNNFNNTTSTQQNGTQKLNKYSNSYTEIFAWGCDNEGQLGLGENKQGKKYAIPRICSFNVVIQQISCGKNHSAFIASNGYVYTMGSNEFGKLGLSHQQLIKNAFSPQLVESIQKFKAIGISCGFEHTGVVCSNGEVFTWGKNTDGQLGLGNYVNQYIPQKISFNHIQTINSSFVKQLSFGAYHSSVLLEYGEVCSFGQNEKGQLGIGNSTNESLPKMNEFIQEITTMISCGYHYSLFLTKSMKVLACGDNSEGQLGLGNKRSQLKPVLINKLENIQTIDAKQHSAAINSNGDLFLFGTCMFGEFLFPQKVHNLKKQMVTVSIGDNFGCAIDIDGQIYSWGYNENSQLGLGDQEPRILPTPMVCLKGKKALQIQCGQNYCISLGNTVLVDKDKLKKAVNASKPRTETYNNESVDEAQNRSVYDIPEQNLIPFFRRNSQNQSQYLTQNKNKSGYTNMISTNSQQISQINPDCSFISSPEKSMYQHRFEEIKNVKSIKQQQLDLINYQANQQPSNNQNHFQNNINQFQQQTNIVASNLQNSNEQNMLIFNKQNQNINRQQNLSNQLLPQYNGIINDNQSPLNLSAIEQPPNNPTTAFVSQNYAEDDEQLQQNQQNQVINQLNQHSQFDSNKYAKNCYVQEHISNYKKQYNMVNQKIRSKSSGKNIIKENSNLNSVDTTYLLQQGASQVFSKFNRSFNQEFLDNQNQSFEIKKHSQSYFEEPEREESWKKILQQKELIIKRLKEEIAELKEDHNQEMDFLKQSLEQEKILNIKIKEQVETLKKREIQMAEQINEIQTEMNQKIKEIFDLNSVITSLEKKLSEQNLISTKQLEQLNTECNSYKKKIKEFELRLLDESQLNYQNYILQMQQKDQQNDQLRNVIQNLENRNRELEETLNEFNQTGSQFNFSRGTQQIQISGLQNSQQIKKDRNYKQQFLNSSTRKQINDSSRISNNVNLSPYIQQQTLYQNNQLLNGNLLYQNQNRCVSPTQVTQNNIARQPFQQISVNQQKLANIVSRSPFQQKQNQANQIFNKSQRDFSNNSSISYNQYAQDLEQQKQQSQTMINKFEKSANKILTMLTSESPEKYTFDQNDLQSDQQLNYDASFKKDRRHHDNYITKNEYSDATPKQQANSELGQIYRDISNFELKDNRSKSLEKRMQDFEKRLKESSQKNK
ncbi:hypothetical protein ABPG72_007799 [Tetrahymena utriculariae]